MKKRVLFKALILMIAVLLLSSCSSVKDGIVCEVYMDHTSYYITGNKSIYDGKSVSRASDKNIRVGGNNMFTISEKMKEIISDKPAQFDFQFCWDDYEVAVFHDYSDKGFSYVWILRDDECKKILLPPHEDSFINCVRSGDDLILVRYPLRIDQNDEISIYTVVLNLESGEFEEFEHKINVTEYFAGESYADGKLWQESGYFGSAVNLIASDGNFLYLIYPTPHGRDDKFEVYSWFFKVDLRNVNGETYIKRLYGDESCLAFDDGMVYLLTKNDWGRTDGYLYSYNTKSGEWQSKKVCDGVKMLGITAYHDGKFWIGASDGTLEKSCIYTYDVSTGELEKSATINGALEHIALKKKTGNRYTDLID